MLPPPAARAQGPAQAGAVLPLLFRLAQRGPAALAGLLGAQRASCARQLLPAGAGTWGMAFPHHQGYMRVALLVGMLAALPQLGDASMA